MIIMFTGLPGSGKSYDAIRKLCDNLRMGRVIYSNIEGLEDQDCREHIKALTGLSDYELHNQLRLLSISSDAQFNVYNFHSFAEHGSLIMIDEVHKHYSNREWQSQKNNDLANWASTHRHYGYDVVFITQNTVKVDSHVRSLVEWTYRFRKINFLGSKVNNRYLEFSYEGDDEGGTPLAKHVRSYDKRYFKCYKSTNTNALVHQSIMTHTNILRHPVFYSIPIVFAVFLWLVFSKSSIASGDIFGSKKVMQKYDDMRKTKVATKPAVPSPSPFPNVSSSKNIAAVPLPVPPPAPFGPVSTSVKAVHNKGPSENYIWEDKDGMIHISNIKETIPPGTKYKTKVL